MPAITFTVTLHTVDLESLAEAGRKAASDSFDIDPAAQHEDSWNAYRASYGGGPAAADLNELIATMLAQAMPLGGYDFDTSAYRISEETPTHG